MNNIPLKSISDLKVFNHAAKTKHHPRKDVLQNLRARVGVSYRNYYSYRNRLEQYVGLSFSPPESESLRHCYDSPSQMVSRIKARLLSLPDILAGECPYCRIGEPETLDHYLPKALFPEFSIFSLNLVPVCGRCNNLKSDSFLDSGCRSFLHPYFDLLEGNLFLCAEVYVQSGTPAVSFYLDNSNYIDQYVYDVICRHFKSLNLGERYRKKGVALMSEIVYSAEFRIQPSQLKALFLSEAERVASRKGPNCWEAAMYRAMHVCDDFIYLCTES